jgi:hypothetical protein
MVTHLVLVQTFKVRILVGQQARGYAKRSLVSLNLSQACLSENLEAQKKKAAKGSTFCLGTIQNERINDAGIES